MDLDANGWVKSLPATQNNGTTPPRYTQVGTLMLVDMQDSYPTGRYVVQYEGVGQLDYRGAGRKLESAPGRDVIEVSNSDAGVNLRILATDPQKTGDYIRNIRVYREADLPLVELGLTFNPAFLEKVKEFGSLRFMDWMRTNHSTQRHWADRATRDSATWATDKGVPVEVMVELANLTGQSPWFNMPHEATDDYMRQFAAYVRDNLDPKLQAYVEFSNEVWNWIFSQAQYAVQQAEARWGKDIEAGWMQWYGMRTAQMAQIWKETFGSQKQRLTTVISTHTKWKGLENAILNTPAWVKEGNQPAYKSVDAYAITGYFSGGLGNPEHAETVQSWLQDPDGGMAKALQQLKSGGLLKAEDAVADAIASFRYHGEVARQRGLKLVAYEGGQHLVNANNLSNSGADNRALSDFFIALNRRPEMQQLYAELLAGWKASGGELFNHFVGVSRPTRFGSWGALENLNQTGSPKYDALMEFLGQNPRWWNESDTESRLGEYRRGDAANNQISGGSDDDILLGGDGADLLSGDMGRDRLHGEAGDDQINGGVGNDRMVGGLGQDTIFGEAGNDLLNGGAGDDQLEGGAGQDTYQFGTTGTGRAFRAVDLGVDQIQFEVGADRISLDPKT
ncbi:MAG: calcium-binding protein, partial [Elainella sp.]